MNAAARHKAHARSRDKPDGLAAAHVPTEARTRFTAAEGRLYPTAMSDPEGFQRATTLVGLVAEALRRTCADIPAVLDGREEMVARLPALAEAAGEDAGGLPADAVVDAASALRCRELQAGAPLTGRGNGPGS